MLRRTVLAGLAASLATAARASDDVPPAATLVRPVANPVDASGLKIKGADGAPVPLQDWRGRWVVLNLWGPWCLPCRREMPSLSRLSDALDPAHMLVMPLAFERRGARWVEKFYRETEITNLPVLLGDGQDVNKVLGLANLPTTAILDPDLRHVFTVSGEASWDDAVTLKWLNSL